MAYERAGQPAREDDLIDIAEVVTAYYTRDIDPDNPDQQVAFGTSGHRGSSLDNAFNEAHILATTQAIVEHRAQQGVTGPLLIGRDTHALSEPAWRTALEVLVGNGVTVIVDSRDGYTPTPAVSHAILRLNAGGAHGQVDGIVDRMVDEVGRDATIVATGGLASLIGPYTRSIELIEPWLTLHGLRLIFKKNVD